MAIRAEPSLAAYPDLRLVEQTTADVDAYLVELGCRTGLNGRQFRQAVDAIQHLFVLAGLDWLERVDWAHWRDSVRALGADHPTVARDYGPVPGAAPSSRSAPTRGRQTSGMAGMRRWRRSGWPMVAC